jgi:hypothetical protein
MAPIEPMPRTICKTALVEMISPGASSCAAATADMAQSAPVIALAVAGMPMPPSPSPAHAGGAADLGHRRSP